MKAEPRSGLLICGNPAADFKTDASNSLSLVTCSFKGFLAEAGFKASPWSLLQPKTLNTMSDLLFSPSFRDRLWFEDRFLGVSRCSSDMGLEGFGAYAGET